ncbi:MAG: beta strand repeat-containing protein [Gammaproteobacteria bacterium]
MQIIADGAVTLDSNLHDVNVLAVNMTDAGTADDLVFVDTDDLTIDTVNVNGLSATVGIDTNEGNVTLTTLSTTTGSLTINRQIGLENQAAGPGPYGDLRLNIGTSVGDGLSGAILASNVEILARGAVILDSGLHDVVDGVLAGDILNNSAGNFVFHDVNGLEIGTFGTPTIGVRTFDGAIDLRALDGSLVVSSPVTARTNGGNANSITLVADDANNSGGVQDIQINAAVTAQSTALGDLFFTADDGIVINNVAVTGRSLTGDADADADVVDKGTFAITGAAGLLSVTGGDSNIEAADIAIDTGTPSLGIDATGRTLTLRESDDRGMGIGASLNPGSDYRLDGAEMQLVRANLLIVDGGAGDVIVDGISGPNSNNISNVEIDSNAAVRFRNLSSTFNSLTVIADVIDSDAFSIITADGDAGSTDLVLDAGSFIDLDTHIQALAIPTGDVFIREHNPIGGITVTIARDIIAGGDIDFQLDNTSTVTFDSAVVQDVDATGDVLADNVILRKDTAGDLRLIAGGDVGTLADRIHVSINEANAGLQIQSGANVFLASLKEDADSNGSTAGSVDGNLRITALQTGAPAGAPDEVDIVSEGFIQFEGNYTNLVDDEFTLAAQTDLTFNTAPLTISKLDADFGLFAALDAPGGVLTVDAELTATGPGNVIDGGQGNDLFDFNANTNLALDGQLNGHEGADVFSLVDTVTGITVTANIAGDVGADKVEFGTPRNPPPALTDPPSPANTSGDKSRLVGSIDLGNDFDTIDFSGIQQVGYAGDLISGAFFNVDTVIGNNSSQLTGPDGDTFWIITDVGTGEFNSAVAPTPAGHFGVGSFSTTFRNFSILAGPGNDTFFFGPNGAIAGGGNGQNVKFDELPGTSGRNGTIKAGASTIGIVGQGGTNVLVGSVLADTFTFSDTNIPANGIADTIELRVGSPVGPRSTLTDITRIDSTLEITFSGVEIDDGLVDANDPNETVFVDADDLGADGIDAGDDVFIFENGVVWNGSLEGGRGNDTINATAYDANSPITATIEVVANSLLVSDGMQSTDATFAEFSGIETLLLGAADDTISFSAAPGNGPVTVNGGGGTDSLVALGGIATPVWNLTANNSGTLRSGGNPEINFASFETAQTVNTGDFTFNGFSFLGPITGNVTIDDETTSFGALGVDIRGNLTLNRAGGAQTLTTTGAGSVEVAGALDTANDLTINAGDNQVTVGGAVTAASLAVTGRGGTNLGSVTTSGAVSLDGGAGGVTVQGATTTNGGAVTVSGAGVHSFAAVDTSGAGGARGSQTYAGTATLRGDITGANLTFTDVVVVNDLALDTSTGFMRIEGNVSSAVGPVLSLVPPPGTDLFIDAVNDVGHINAAAFENFDGTLAIGGRLFTKQGSTTMLDGVLQSANANYIGITEDFITGGNLMLLGSAIELTNAPGQALRVTAGAAGATGGEIVMIAFGDAIVTFDAVADVSRTALGNIAGPETGTVTITGRQAALAATGELLNTTNMIMNMGGGTVAVAQSDTARQQQVQFSVQSNARESAVVIADTNLFTTLSGTNVTIDGRFVRAASLLAPGVTSNALFQNARVSFPNPAAVLTLLQAVSFVDSSLFEEDLSLFGQIGNGIALSLDQCEDAEGCAPSVTEEELVALIEALNERISRLEALIEAGQIDREEGERLLAGYRQQLQNFLDYQEQLVAYNKAKEADEFGDDFGDEFEDVFEAEETLEPADEAAPADEAEPAEELPAFDEATEEPFEPIEQEAAPSAEEPAAAPEFEDLDEAVESFDAEPAPAPAAEPAPADDGGEPEFDDLDGEFEEFEEELDDMLLNQLGDPRAVNQLAGTVRIGADGRVAWSGDVVLPTLHRRF